MEAIYVGIDVAPDLGELGVAVAVERVELARIVHDDLENARRRARELEEPVGVVVDLHGRGLMVMGSGDRG